MLFSSDRQAAPCLCEKSYSIPRNYWLPGNAKGKAVMVTSDAKCKEPVAMEKLSKELTIFFGTSGRIKGELNRFFLSYGVPFSHNISKSSNKETTGLVVKTFCFPGELAWVQTQKLRSFFFRAWWLLLRFLLKLYPERQWRALISQRGPHLSALVKMSFNRCKLSHRFIKRLSWDA